VWLVRSTGTVSHWTFVQQLHNQLSITCSRHLFSRSYFTDYKLFRRVWSSNIVRRLVVTLSMLLRLINCPLLLLILCFSLYVRTLQRRWCYSLQLLLQFLISLMSFVTFVIDVVAYVGLRMIILFTLALTCIMFKCSISTQLPRLSYLTLVVRSRYKCTFCLRRLKSVGVCSFIF